MKGELFIIGTPIGNLGDVTPRSKTILGALDVLFCEDTRVSAPLMSLLGVRVHLRALSDDLPEARVTEAIDLVRQGKKVGFVSDAGMPGVSDPARRLTRAAWEMGISPVVIPGVSALSMIVSACPFVDGEFIFAGFAGRRGAEREAFVRRIADSQLPSFFFEGRSRVHGLVDAICETVDPQRRIIIGREMTKMHEQIICFKAEDWATLRETVPDKGEFSLGLEAAPPQTATVDEQHAGAALERLRDAGFSSRDAVKAYAASMDLSVNDVKKLAYGSKPS